MSLLGRRFEVRRSLGSGGFGDVYLAHDRERGGLVAVKRLRTPSPGNVQRLKREFRSLSHLHHTNLVTLYELCVEGNEWLLTMEPVEGASPEGEEQWRRALPQIGAGLEALHASGFLHRDLKADNIRITPQGRCVLLDFGLLTRAGPGEGLVGSAQTIAPEQLAGHDLGPPSDWYAVGALLFEALTGRAPFGGRGSQVLARKMAGPAPQLTPSEHGELAPLVNALLRRDPAARMREAEPLLHALGTSTFSAPREDPLLSRERELRSLEQALERARSGRLVRVRVSGEPGMGKTHLLRAFARAHHRAVWIRCHERDGSAYAGLDAVAEAALKDDPRPSADEERALLTIFPGLGDAPVPAMEPVHTRTLAAGALRRWLRVRAGDGCPIVIVDDAQWGGRDTGELLAALIEPPWLVVEAVRARMVESGLSAELAARAEESTTVELHALDPTEPELAEEQRELVRLGRGHPLFVAELSRARGDARDLEELLARRARELPKSAETLMRILMAAARPLESNLAVDAYGRLADSDGDALLGMTALSRRRWITFTHTAKGRLVEPTHALIRDACERALGVGAQEHGALDDAMEAMGVAEPDLQARHAREAGRPERAARLYLRAARREYERLAFARAAQLYAEGEACSRDQELRRRLAVGRAEALGAAGLHAEAAAAFLQAADEPENNALLALDLRRRHMEHLFHAGDANAGEAALEACVSLAGLRTPTGRRGLLASVLWHLAWITRAPDPPRDETPDAHRRASIDLCHSAALALTNLDGVRGMDFVLRGARLAHRAGDLRRFSRAFALIAAYSASRGVREHDAVVQRIRRARALAERIGDPRTRGTVEAAECLRLFHEGDHRRSLAQARRVERIFRDEAAAPREATTAAIYGCANLAVLGRFTELRAERRRLLADATARRDGFGETYARIGVLNLIWLQGDDPTGARAELERGMERWRQSLFQQTHFFALLAHARIDLYEGDPQTCLRRLRGAGPDLRASMLLRMAFIRAHVSDLIARASIAAAVGAGRGRARELLRCARREAKRIRALRTASLSPMAEVIDAGVALHGGDRDGARRHLETASGGYRAVELMAHADAAASTLRALGVAAEPCLLASDAPRAREHFAAALGLDPRIVRALDRASSRSEKRTEDGAAPWVSSARRRGPLK